MQPLKSLTQIAKDSYMRGSSAIGSTARGINRSIGNTISGGFRLLRPRAKVVKAASSPMKTEGSQKKGLETIVKATPGGRTFQRRANDIERALNDEF